MKKILLILILIFSSKIIWAADAFEMVRCGKNISKVLMGKRIKNEAVSKIEALHKDILLKNNYGCEEDGVCMTSWDICGTEFLIAENNASVIQDVLAIPSHSNTTPFFSALPGTCQAGGKTIPEEVIGIMNRPAGAKQFSANLAWKIVDKKIKFIKIATENLICPEDSAH